MAEIAQSTDTLGLAFLNSSALKCAPSEDMVLNVFEFERMVFIPEVFRLPPHPTSFDLFVKHVDAVWKYLRGCENVLELSLGRKGLTEIYKSIFK